MSEKKATKKNIEQQKELWHTLSGDVYYTLHGGKFLFKEHANVGSDSGSNEKAVYFILEFLGGESLFLDQAQVNLLATIQSVCPAMIPKELKKKIMNDLDWMQDPPTMERLFTSKGGFKKAATENDMHMFIEAAHSYGTRAYIDETHYRIPSEEEIDPDEVEEGADEREELQVWEWAAEKCKMMGTFIGFQLDKQANMIGATGWDFLRGDVIPPSMKKAAKKAAKKKGKQEA